MLVLGRPGSGCTSLLRVLSNDRASFDEVDGETRYGSADHKEAERFRQQIMFNNEGKQHPVLTRKVPMLMNSRRLALPNPHGEPHHEVCTAKQGSGGTS